jgi:hypothetical protein
MNQFDPDEKSSGTVHPSERDGQQQITKPSKLAVIAAEPPDTIHVGAGGKLEVPREDFDVDLDDGAELDLHELQAKKIRKPGRREWIALSLGSELPTRLLLHKQRPDSIETEYYFIDKALRGPIHDELKDVRVFAYYSFKAKAFALLIVHVTLQNSWYESISQLLKQPADFFKTNAIRIIPDKPNSRYRVRSKPLPTDVTWPTKSTGELLAEALGADHMITSPDHEIYRELIEGVEINP